MHTCFLRTCVLFLAMYTLCFTSTYAVSAVITSRLSKGANNNVSEVRDMQQTLKDLGYYKGSVDGHMGSLTEASLKLFQFDHNITPSGATGPNTRAALADPLGALINSVANNKANTSGGSDGSGASGNTNNVLQVTDEACSRSVTCSTFGKDVYLASRQVPAPVEDKVSVPVNQVTSSASTQAHGATTVTVSDSACNSSIFCSVFGKTAYQSVFGLSSAHAPVEDHTGVPVNNNNNPAPQNTRSNESAATMLVNNPNNAADVSHFINTGYSGVSNQNQGSQNTSPNVSAATLIVNNPNNAADVSHFIGTGYSGVSNQTQGPTVVQLPTVTVTAKSEPFNPAQFTPPVQLPVAGLMPNLSQPGDYSNSGQDYGHEQNHSVQAPAQESSSANAFNNGQGEGSGTDRRSITTGVVQRLQEQAKDGPVEGPSSADGCFVAGTKILMSDLSLKNIEDIKIGDYVMTPEGSSTVNKLMRFDHDGDIYSYNNKENYFFTPNHPFMTTQGWRSFKPSVSMKETPIIVVSTTTIGDILLKYNSQEKILSYQKKHMKGFVYNFTVANSHTYFANGYLVHNLKQSITGGESSSGESYPDP